jgi:two-component system CheB/CheR fusion protein
MNTKSPGSKDKKNSEKSQGLRKRIRPKKYSTKKDSRSTTKGQRANAIVSVESDGSFPIVGIGASAGGLEAFRELLEHLPVDTGMAFVLVSHLDPTHKSILTELLARKQNFRSLRLVTE